MTYKHIFFVVVLIAAGFLLAQGIFVFAQSTSCSSALIALLGDRCHYMYNDSVGNSIYCNGAMTLSAKSGDIAVTQGCSFSTTASSSTTTISTTSTCTSALIALLGDDCHYMYNDSSGNAIYCNGAMTQSAKSGDTAVTQGCTTTTATPTTTTATSTTTAATPTTTATTQPPVISNASVTNITSSSVMISWTTDQQATSKIEYWVGTVSGAFQEDISYVTYHSITLAGLAAGTTYTFNVVSRDANYYTGYVYNRTFTTLGSSLTTTTTSSCPSGYHPMVPYESTGYCMSDTDGSVCQPLGGGAIYTCQIASTATAATTTTTTQITSTASCPSGYHYMYPYTSGDTGYCMSDTSSYTCQPLGGGVLYACPGYSSGTTTTATTTVSTTSVCDSALIGLLGSGCHYMYNDSFGNQVYCNEAMTQSAKKGDTAVTQGCSYSGGITTTQSACDADLTKLLGEGCHYMYSDASNNPVYCNGAMTLAAKKGDIAVTQGCSSTPFISDGFIITSVSFVADTEGRGKGAVSFSRTIDQTTLTDENIGLFRVADGLRIGGKIIASASGFEYLSFEPVAGGFFYEFRIKKNVRDSGGKELYVDYVSPPFTPAVVSIKTFSVDFSRTSPAQNAAGVDVASRIRVSFTKDINPASLKTQFFSLVNMALPSEILSGTFSVFSDVFEFVPVKAFLPNTKYLYNVFATIQDTTGAFLSAPFSASFSTASDITVQGGTVSGKVIDSAGNPVGRAFVYFSQSSVSFSRNIETGPDGAFSVILPAGVYTAEVFPPLGRVDLIKPDIAAVSVQAGSATSLNFRFGLSVKTITGLVLFTGGSPVLDAEVGAYSSESGQQARSVVDGKGRYTLKVDGGVWQIGIRPSNPATASWSYAGPFPKVSFAKDIVAETEVVDFSIARADGTLIVKTVDQNGTAVPNAGVIVDTVSSGQIISEVRLPPQFKSSDAAGSVTFFVRGGTYYVRGALSPELGYLNPDEQSIAVYSGETRTITLALRKRDAITTVFLSGITKREDGTPTDAYIWAWSEKGGFANTRSDGQGIFRMQVTPLESWHIGAGKEISGISYKTPETTVAVGLSGAVVELLLTKFSDIPLPPSVSVSQSATEHIVAEATDGAKVSVPPAAAAGSGTVQVEVKPTVEAPTQAAARVVGTVYEITIRDAAGTDITQLKENMEIILPYSEEELKKMGVTENTIAPSFYDEKIALWVSIDNYTVDNDKNIIIARVKHLTRFAIVAAADVTPPPSPTSIPGTALGNGRIKLTWINPTRDFSHMRVYKSERAGSLGEILGLEVRGGEIIDAAVRNGVSYYYTVRAVDPAGNESGNTTQTVVRAVGTSPALAAKTPAASILSGGLSRNLRQGSSGNDIKRLQSLLLKEGVYPEGLVTGYFGSLTKQAVIRFQEKFLFEILTPVGLTAGNGFVGPGTRRKINALLGK